MKYALTIILVCLMSVAVAKAATPAPWSDCGVGTAIDGSKNAGKIVIGPNQSASSCTLLFSWPKVPSCSAMLESPLYPYSSSLGTITTSASLTITWQSGYMPSPVDSDVISYLCVGQ